MPIFLVYKIIPLEWFAFNFEKYIKSWFKITLNRCIKLTVNNMFDETISAF